MRYLKDEVFVDRKGKPIRLTEEGPDGSTTEVLMPIGRLFSTILESYQPTQAFQLKLGELRKMYKVLAVLDVGPIGGYYSIEDEDYTQLQRVVTGLVEQMRGFAFHAPRVADYLDGATTIKPEEEKNESMASSPLSVLEGGRK